MTTDISPQDQTYARGLSLTSSVRGAAILVHKRPGGSHSGDISPDRKYRRKRMGLVHQQAWFTNRGSGLTHWRLTR